MKRTKSLIPNVTLVRVRNAPHRRHAYGTFVRLLGDRVEYRSAHNGGLFLVPLAHVMLDHLNAKMRDRAKERRHAQAA